MNAQRHAAQNDLDAQELHAIAIVGIVLVALAALVALIMLTVHTVAGVGTPAPTPNPTLTAPPWAPSYYQAGHGPGTFGNGLGVRK